MNLPYFAAGALGPDGYLGLPVAALLTLPGLAAIHGLAGRFEGLTLIEQGERILGRVFGRIAGFGYLGFSLLLLAMFTRDIVNMVNTYFLDHSPLYPIVLAYLLPAAYLASRGIETVSRFACFVLLPALAVMFGLALIGFQDVTWTRLLPVAGAGVLPIARGGLSVLYAFYLLGLSAMSLPYLRSRRNFPKMAGGALLVLTLFFVIFSAGAIGVYGHRYVMRFAWPSMEFVHAIQYPYLLLDQAGLLMLIDWITIILAGTGYLYYTIALGASQLTGSLDYKRWVWALLPVKLVLIMLPRNVIDTKAAFTQIARYGWLVLYAYPILLWLVAARRPKGGNADAA